MIIQRAGTKRKLSLQEDNKEEEHEQGGNVDTSKEGGGGGGGGNVDSDTEEEDEGTSVTIDIDILYCIICFLPLRPPLFQCRNGHVSCPSCQPKLRNKCPTCELTTSFSRCLALEKLLESMKVLCANSGCNEKIPFADLDHHQQVICIHSPCFCPVWNCSFSASGMDQLSAHVDSCHEDVFEHLESDRHVPVSIKRSSNPSLRVIQVDGYEELFLLVSHRLGDALSMTCICSQAVEYSFMYELTVHDFGEDSYLTMKAPMTTNLKKWTRSPCFPDFFLTVPRKFDDAGSLQVYITIRKKHVPSAAKESPK